MVMKKGLILVNAYTEMPSLLKPSLRLQEEFIKLGVQVDVKKNNFFPTIISQNGDIKSDLDYDFVVYLDKDKYVSQCIEKLGIPVFNSHNSIQICDDKMTTHIVLSNNGIPMPKTIPGLLCYPIDSNKDVSNDSLDVIEKELGYPMIVKLNSSSLGMNVYIVKNRKELEDISKKVKNVPHMYQQYISKNPGVDIRAIVINNKVVASMKRINRFDFKANIECGGISEPYTLSEENKKMCEKASKILGLDYCGIDLLEDDNGLVVNEVNSNAFFMGIEKTCDINIGKLYAEHICSKVYN